MWKFVLGLIAVLVMMIVVVGLSTGNLSNKNTIEAKYYNNYSFNKINADIKVGSLKIKTGLKYQIKVSGKYAKKVKVNVVKGQLNINEAGWRGVRHKKNINNSNLGPKILVTVPKKIVLDKIKVDNGVGNLNLQSIKTKKAHVELSVGNLEATDSQLNLNADVETGDTRLNNCTLKGTSTVDVEVGSCRVDNLNSLSYDLSTEVGLVSFNGKTRGRDFVKKVSGADKLNVDVEVGSIHVD